MKNILNTYKPIGISPFDAIKLLQEKFSEYQDVSITYAGRLDPMAEGVLLLLADSEVHKKEEYQKLDKEYEAEMLFGFETDTYDILGIPKLLRLTEAIGNMNIFIKKEIENLKGEISLPLPPYSSYKINGPPSPRLRRASKPLFMWAREGRLEEIEIPIRTTTIYKTEFLDSSEISGEDLFKKIKEKINLVQGDFRQEKILSKWQEVLNNNKEKRYLTAKIRFNVSSGTYIRSIAHHLGGILLGLTRTKVGEFYIKDSIKI